VACILTPQVGPGNIIVRMLVANVLSHAREIYDGTRRYHFPILLAIGTSGIGRVAAVGPDTTILRPGELVLADPSSMGAVTPLLHA